MSFYVEMVQYFRNSEGSEAYPLAAGEDPATNSLTVIVFTVFFGIFFLLCEVVASGFLSLIGM